MTNSHHDGSDSSQLPESAQFINESTLIPSSNFEEIDSGERTMPAPREKHRAASGGEKKPGFDIKKNIPLVVVGVIGVILIGSVGVKMMTGGGVQAQAEPAQVTSQAAPALPPMPSLPVVPTAIKAVPLPPLVVAPPVITASAPVAPTAPVVAPVTPVISAAPVTPVVPVAPVASVVPVAPTASIAPATTATTTASAVSALPLSVDNGAAISDLKTRVAKLEAAGRAENSSRSGKGEKSPDAVSAPSTAKDKHEASGTPHAKRAHVPHSAASVEKAEAARLAKATREEKATQITQAAGAYRVTAVKDNLAWLASSDGEVQSYMVGENIPGVGKLTAVDDRALSVTAGGRKIH